jgi:acyl-CoA synthetase (AMP-forming)/AMP-acid ligase II
VTTDSPLLGWLENPSPHRGIRFNGPRGRADYWSYERLGALTTDVVGGLRTAGVGRNDVVVVIVPSGPSFVASFFGVMRIGAVPCPVGVPSVFRDADGYAAHVQAVVGSSGARLVIADDGCAPRIAPLAARSGARTIAFSALAGDGRGSPGRFASLAERALLQFTSGSSGRPRGVVVPYGALESNVAAIQRWLRMTPEDLTASWLPTHHDMGLIGCLITPVAAQSGLWLFRPEEFIRRPLEFLRCFGEHGAALTAMPCFALAYLVRRVAPTALEGMDFSAWRALIVGAERIDSAVLENVVDLLAPHGFARTTPKTAYGLAEATLAVTALPLDQPWTSVALRSSRWEKAVEFSTAGPADVVTACGPPLPGLTVRIADEHGRELPDGDVGEITVAGPSVTPGYVDRSDSASPTRITGATLCTGDAGFVRDGQLYVLGRLGDSVKLLGRSLFAEDLELQARGDGISAERVVAVLGYRAGTPSAVLVFENVAAEEAATALSAVRRRAAGAHVIALCVPRGTIPRTSSGKPQRRRLWAAFCGGTLPGVEIDEREAASGATGQAGRDTAPASR